MKPSWTLLDDVSDAPERDWREVERKRDEYFLQLIGEPLMSELTRQEFEDDLRLVAIERFRCPRTMEVWRHVIPLSLLIAVVFLSLGYAWRMVQ